MNRLMLRSSTAKEILPNKEFLDEEIEDSMVVTLDKNGECLSRFCDDIWDYSATSTSIKSMNFRSKIESVFSRMGSGEQGRENISDAIKFLKIIALHWIKVVGGCSMSKLNGDLVALSHLICYCANGGVPLNHLFKTPEALDFMVGCASSDKQVGILLGKTQRFVDTSKTLCNSPFWNGVTPSSEFFHRLKRFRKKFPETSESIQTLLIPSEIYQSILKKTIEDLNRFLAHRESIEFLFEMRVLARDRAVNIKRRPSESGLTAREKSRVTLHWKALERENSKITNALDELHKADISKSKNWVGVVDYLRRWQYRCAILIAAFTGMRKSELLAIPLNGLKFMTTDDGNIPVVWSSTTKLEKNGVPRFTKWVTSSAVESAFEVARIITVGALSWTDDRSVVDINEEEVPLLMSIEYGKKGKPHPRFHYTATSFGGGSYFEDLYKDELQIRTRDVEEISWFLYGENVPNSIRVGETWPLTFHQFRRSMTVYAAASGQVSYPVLKAQLKHIRMVMTVYYSNLSSRAVNILGDGLEIKALRAEWAEAKARAEADDLFHLLESGLPLAGSAGKKLKSQQANGELPIFFENRKATKQAVKNGKIRYRPTLVGGCMSVAPCNKGAGVLASACISCENAVFLPGSRVALEQTREFYQAELEGNIPKRARQEYEENIRKIDVFITNLVEATEAS